jgi:hypothetical protein
MFELSTVGIYYTHHYVDDGLAVLRHDHYLVLKSLADGYMERIL